MVGIGIIGLGFGRFVQIPGFLKVENAKIIGVVSSQHEHAKEITENHSFAHNFKDWRELVSSGEIDAVSIATPPYLHHEMALEAMRAGKAVLCEKPMAMSADQAKAMMDMALEMEVVNMIDFEFREIPAFKFVKSLMDDGATGAVRHVNINWILNSWSDKNRKWSWRSDHALGGGVLGALGAHTFDYIEWLLGPIKSVAANLTTRIGSRPDESGVMRKVSSEDCCNLLLELEDKTPVSLSISSVASHGKGHSIEIYGERKTLILKSGNMKDYGKGFKVFMADYGKESMAELPVDEKYLNKKEYDAIISRKLDVQPSFKEGYRAQLALEAAVRSNETRSWADIRN